jgi:two-component system sensor histidine kinase/response regulator
MKILIIEDEDALRQTLKDILELNGHEVMVAANGIEGVRLAITRPDFIFCDVSMPGLDGFGTLEAIRQTEAGRLVPFVFLTAMAERADQRRGMALGADDYLTKPFSEKDILDVIAARTRRQRTVQERVEAMMEQHRRQVGANWSHELLTPLNGMLGGLQLLESEADTIARDELKEVIALIRTGAERQETLSRKLIRYFELERIKQDGPRAAAPRCSAETAVRDGVRRAAADAKRETGVELKCAPGVIPVLAVFLADAVTELVSNALFFSRPDQTVIVTGTLLGSVYQIEVLDRGPGMTAEERASETPFTQFDRTRHARQGLGLGLTIVRSVAKLAGGRLTLEYGPGGSGLRAVLELRAVQA